MPRANTFGNQRGIVLLCTIVPFLLVTPIVYLAFVKPQLELREYKPQNGDVIFQSLPRNDLVNAIEGVSESPPLYCGMFNEKKGKWWVLEAIGPVKSTGLSDWVARGRKEGFAVYRLLPEYQGRIEEVLAKGFTYLNHPYDLRYRMDDEAIYCSELIFKAFRDVYKKDLGSLVTLGSMNWKTYELTIRKYENGEPPLDREMITPRGLSESPLLRLVIRKNI